MTLTNIATQRHDKVIDLLMDLKERTSKIEEHLETLNGKVVRHEKELIEQEDNIKKIDKTMNKWIGGLAVVMIILQIIMF